jgi:predicted Zn-dependent protease
MSRSAVGFSVTFLARSACRALVKKVRREFAGSRVTMRLLRRQTERTTLDASKGWCIRGASLLAALLLGNPLVYADVPVNGRSQELDFTSEAVRTIAAADYAKRLQRFQRLGLLDRDTRLLARVRKIASALIAQATILKPGARRWGWEVHVVGSNRFDAFSMAGGKILVSAPFVRAHDLSDGELAALLAHEIAHALAEHVREQLTAARKLDPAYRHLGAEDMASAMEWDLSISLRLAELSRLHELEADDIGIYLAAKAGFDPRALVQFYRKLSSVERGQHLIDTHGAAESRMRIVENFAAYAEVLYREYTARRQPAGVLLR